MKLNQPYKYHHCCCRETPLQNIYYLVNPISLDFKSLYVMLHRYQTILQRQLLNYTLVCLDHLVWTQLAR